MGLLAFDRDLRLLALSTLYLALGAGLYVQLLGVYALQLGASPLQLGALNAVLLATTALGNLLGAWACGRFRLRSVIVIGRWVTVPAGLAFVAAPTWAWLLPGLILSGLYLANGPAFKSYIYLKSSPGRRAHTMTVVYGAYPLGLVVAPLAGGWLAAHAGMRVVFLLAVLFFVASSLTISGIRDVPYSAAGEVWRVRDMRADGVFARYLAFFAVAFTASYVALPLLAPYLHLAHGQSYTSLGIYLAIASAGAALLTPLAGRISDRRGPDAGWAVVLLAMAAGSLLLLAGGSRSMWALGAFFAGGLDAVRFVAAGLVAGGFQRVPLAWGYALFDAMMGLPMAGGALLGGLLFRAGFGLPFLVAASVAAGLILAIVLGRSPLGAVVRPSTVSGASEA